MLHGILFLRGMPSMRSKRKRMCVQWKSTLTCNIWKWWQCSAKVNMNLFKDLFETFYFLIKFLHVFCASSSSLFSSSSLYFKLADFLRPLSLSNVIGSIMQEASVLTRLIATYEMPAVFSVWPMSIHAFGSDLGSCVLLLPKPVLTAVVVAHAFHQEIEK